MIGKMFSLLRHGETASGLAHPGRDRRGRNLREIFSHIPILETERLILRRIVPDDYMDMYDYASSDEVTRYLTWYSHISPDQSRDYIGYLQTRYNEGKFFDWGLEHKEDGRMIGTCGFTTINLLQNKAEVGYVLSRKYWGRALMPEALDEVIRFGFEELLLGRLEARFIDGNDKSRSVMVKCGMSFESTSFNSFRVKDEYKTVHTYALSRNEYLKRKAAVKY